MLSTKKMVCRALCILTFTLASAALGCTQDLNRASGSSDKITLPRLFSKFSQNDVFEAIFADFDRTTGRVRHILNEQKQPSLVQLNQARLWKSGGKDYLVVMIDIGGYDEQFGIPGLCGACASASPIAVLRAANNKLELVAEQDDDLYASKDGEDHSTGFEAFWYTGHDSEVRFDLAPYRLNRKEMLIGVRFEHMWIPAHSFSTTLQLFRIEGTRIRKVFDEFVVDRDWTDDPKKPRLSIDKSISTLTMIRSSGKFNQIVATRKTKRCLAKADEWDCNGGRLVKTDRETWKFDGTRFVSTRSYD